MRPLPLSLAQVLLLVVVTLLWPLYDYLHGWPRTVRQLSAGAPDGRVSTYREVMLVEWALVGACAAAWAASGRRWGAPALSAPSGARLWGPVCLVGIIVALQVRQLGALRRGPVLRAAVSRKVGSTPWATLLPATRRELAWMYPLCLTAGVCEELLFRGFVVWGLSVPFGWWGAGAASVLSFGLLHAYQGTNGVLRTAAFGLVMTVLVGVTRSLWPAVALHALFDVGSVTLLYVALHGSQPTS